MQVQVEALKNQLSVLEYLNRHHWQARPVGSNQEFVGLCPLHPDQHPSFYVNTRKNVFYCHGCGCGGDIIRLVELLHKVSFRDAVAHLTREFELLDDCPEAVLNQALAFYQSQLPDHGEALYYVHRRGLRDPALMRQMGMGYAPGGCLQRHMAQLGYSAELLLQIGLINRQGHDSFYRRIVLPCFDHGRLVNLYGRSIDGGAAHRFLARPKGGLFAWNQVRSYPALILVEGPFDLAVLWQAGFPNTTCGFGVHLARRQFEQLCDVTDRQVFIAFDSDPNGAGQTAARALALDLVRAGLGAGIVMLPHGHDPNSYFVSGASAKDFRRCLELAEVAQ